MIVGLRRVLTVLVAGVVVSLGAAPVLSASAATPTPTPVATATATPSSTATTTPTDSEAPDVAPDNSRQVWALGGAGVVALVAAAAVFLRRR